MRSALAEWKYSELHALLLRFEENPLIQNALKRRHALTHRLQIHDPKWPSLQTINRVLSAVAIELDPDSERLKELEEAPNLKAFCEEKGDELLSLLRLIGGLRLAICEQMVKLGV